MSEKFEQEFKEFILKYKQETGKDAAYDGKITKEFKQKLNEYKSWFEEETGNNAIWKGKITKQWKQWANPESEEINKNIGKSQTLIWKKVGELTKDFKDSKETMEILEEFVRDGFCDRRVEDNGIITYKKKLTKKDIMEIIGKEIIEIVKADPNKWFTKDELYEEVKKRKSELLIRISREDFDNIISN